MTQRPCAKAEAGKPSFRSYSTRMSTQKPRALDVPLQTDDARASLLRALHLLGGEESAPLEKTQNRHSIATTM